jgi:N6-adenosine-specific RNA methylase IME4
MGVKTEDAEEYTQSLGQIVAGSWRQVALAKRLGVPRALGLDVKQWVQERLGGYIQMSIPERREAVRNLTDQNFSAREIADIVGVSHDTAARDVRILTPLDAVAALAADDAVQKQIEADVKKAEKEVRRLAKRNGKAIENGCKVEDLCALIAAGKKFSVIYADPPWEFKVYSGKGKQRSAERHYDTVSLDDIKALPVGNLAASDCALFLWCVMPELPGALDVIHAWGFEYKTVAFVWVKTNENDKFVELNGSGLHWGMGYWTRANAELCLLATKGAPRRLDEGVHQVIVSPVSEHSRKPDKAQQRIEQLLGEPSGETHLELFGRRTTDRWTVWGNEVSSDLFRASIPDFETLEVTQ